MSATITITELEDVATMESTLVDLTVETALVSRMFWVPVMVALGQREIEEIETYTVRTRRPRPSIKDIRPRMRRDLIFQAKPALSQYYPTPYQYCPEHREGLIERYTGLELQDPAAHEFMPSPTELYDFALKESSFLAQIGWEKFMEIGEDFIKITKRGTDRGIEWDADRKHAARLYLKPYQAFGRAGHKYWIQASVQAYMWFKAQYGNMYYQTVVPVAILSGKIKHEAQAIQEDIFRYLVNRKPDDYQAIVSSPVYVMEYVSDTAEWKLHYVDQRQYIPMWPIIQACINPYNIKRFIVSVNRLRWDPVFPSHTALYWTWGYRRASMTRADWYIRKQIDANIRRQRIGVIDNFFNLDRIRLWGILWAMRIGPYEEIPSTW